MANLGWTFNEADSQWELMSRTGLVIQTATLEFLHLFGAAQLNRYGARRGWPELVPGAAWVHCILHRGPMDGRHVFYEPAVCAQPPEVLTSDDQPPDLYRRQWRPACTHGAGCVACPYPYLWDPDGT